MEGHGLYHDPPPQPLHTGIVLGQVWRSYVGLPPLRVELLLHARDQVDLPHLWVYHDMLLHIRCGVLPL
jgi:hypothetical protein